MMNVTIYKTSGYNLKKKNLTALTKRRDSRIFISMVLWYDLESLRLVSKHNFALVSPRPVNFLTKFPPFGGAGGDKFLLGASGDEENVVEIISIKFSRFSIQLGGEGGK